jgi:uncharacterized repeat protein (TIGR03803 family)
MKLCIKNFLVLSVIAGLASTINCATAQTFTNLHHFTATSDQFPAPNSDGANPYGGLILSGGILYGTAGFGGAFANGTVFAINANGTGFTNLHSFSSAEGIFPQAKLLLAGSTLYGTAGAGGYGEAFGTVFAINTNGTGFTNLHSFTYDTDGNNPRAGLVLSGSTLYGTTSQGGSSSSQGSGSIFAINTDGSGFTNLHRFTTLSSSGINSDGAGPEADLILSGNVLYGTARNGGMEGSGTVFAINIDARVLRTCIVSQHVAVLPILQIVMEVFLKQV